MDLEEYCCQDPNVLQAHNEVCRTRRETGFCPQLPKIDQLIGKINWLLEKYQLDLDIEEIPERCDPE